MQRRNEAGVRVDKSGMGTNLTPGRPSAGARISVLLAALLLCACGAWLSGCSATSFRADPTKHSTRVLGRRVWVIVTTDGGRTLLTRHSVPLETGDTTASVLRKVADVRTAPDGTIAQVDGRGGGALGTFGPKPEAWFYRVDGIESTGIRPDKFLLKPGQSVWWDLRRFDIYDRLPVAVGTFPEPLFSGWRDAKRQLRIAYAPGFEKDAEFIRDSIFGAIEPELKSLKGDSGGVGIGGEDNGSTKNRDTTLAVRRNATNLIIGRYEHIRLDPYVLDINLDNRGYGITAWVEGTEIWRQDPAMELSQRLANAEGLVWASTIDGQPDSTLVYVVTGTTDEGVRAALRALRSGGCQFYLACAVDRDGEVIR
ncbi:MAG: rane protein [Thermoleophilia bacterium]|nr:rane protein [Thermoleophilia bacterium]